MKIKVGLSQFADVDEIDFEKLNQFRWSFHSAGYATRNRARILMHREIMNAPRGMVVDHIDGNRLNNQRSNLRVCSHKENCRNQKKQIIKRSSRFKGVSLYRNGKWRVAIKLNQVDIHIGYFESEESAALAYNKKALDLFGEFAKLNVVNRD